MKAIVLAAGLSRRMRTQKLLLPFGRGTVLSTVVYNVLGAGFDEVVLVVSKDTQGVCTEPALGSPRLREVLNESPERGQSSSLRLGVSAAEEGDFCVTLADLPLVSSEELVRYRALFDSREAEYTALVPCRDGRFGHPSFFAPLWRDRLCGAEGDVGGRDALRAYAAEVLYTSGEDSFFTDMDTPEEYGQIRRERL